LADVPSALFSWAFEETDRSIAARLPPAEVTLPVPEALDVAVAVSPGTAELVYVTDPLVVADTAGPFSTTGTSGSAPPVGV
jgi:hypothetical protein